MGLHKRTWTRYVDRKTGKRSKKNAPGAEKRTEKSKDWYGTYRDADGIARTARLSPNKAAAELILADLKRDVEKQRAGLASPFVKRPLADHLDEFEQDLRNQGNTEDYCRLKRRRAEAVIDGCRFSYPGDISASRVQEFLAELKRSRAQQTVNHYLTAVKQFTRWLVQDHRTAENRLAHLQGGNAKLDPRHPRRELTSEELSRLFEAARNGRTRKPLTGEQRYLLYATAVGTGLRASELASLTAGHFDLDAEIPTVRIDAADEKARRGDVLPLSNDLVELLRPYLATLDAKSRLWPGPWAEKKRAGEWMQADLKAARDAWVAEAEKADDAAEKAREQSDFLTYETEAGFADFHALRHTFASRLGRLGVPTKVMMELVRHTTSQMTMRYTHAHLFDLAGAVNGLPPLPSIGERTAEHGPAVALRATGTEGKPPVLAAHLAAHVDASTCGQLPSIEETNPPDTGGEEGPQSLPMRAVAGK